jgi:hypothetical protein
MMKNVTRLKPSRTTTDADMRCTRNWTMEPDYRERGIEGAFCPLD